MEKRVWVPHLWVWDLLELELQAVTQYGYQEQTQVLWESSKHS